MSTTTISSSLGGSFSPDLVLGYDTATESQNVIHRIINRLDPDVSLVGDGLRTGELRMFFLTRTSAYAAQALLAAGPATFGLADSDLPQLNMSFVRTGRMTLELDSQTVTRWLLNAEYQEIS